MSARIVEIDESSVGQRIDNYLVKVLKGVPKTRIYRALRKGEVRVNGGRVKAPYTLKLMDKVRTPPIRFVTNETPVVVPPNLLKQIPVLFEDDCFLIVDKPSGLSVHGGSGQPYGLIEAFRALRETSGFLELAHRLDRETSGCLVLCKKRDALVAFQKQLSADDRMRKTYQTLLNGDLAKTNQTVRSPLKLKQSEGARKRMIVHPDGQQAWSEFSVTRRFDGHTLVSVILKTGRMHQVRAHADSLGHPVAGDDLYGDHEYNREMKRLGLGRLFLHASELRFEHPVTLQPINVSAPMPESLQQVIARLMQRQESEDK